MYLPLGDDYNASVQLGFVFLQSWIEDFVMLQRLAEIRKVRSCAVCALLLACALVAAGAAVQSSGKASGKKPSSRTTSATSQKHHKKSTKNSAASSTTAKTTRTAHTKSSGKKSARKKKVRGQQKIDSERALAIQTALIREHYLSGEPAGTWNQESEEAMRRYQSDHGWQTKEVPDSRALIKLGLGPSKDRLLNPESAMVTAPDTPRGSPAIPTATSKNPADPQ